MTKFPTEISNMAAGGPFNMAAVYFSFPNIDAQSSPIFEISGSWTRGSPKGRLSFTGVIKYYFQYKRPVRIQVVRMAYAVSALLLTTDLGS